MNFKIGQKVVCVATFRNCLARGFEADTPIKDQIYTINGFGPEGSLRFEELYTEPGFGYFSRGFKPLDENFAKDILANITEQIEKEELVLV